MGSLKGVRDVELSVDYAKGRIRISKNICWLHGVSLEN